MLPVDMKKSGANTLAITWDDGHESLFAMDTLRKKCPCATCKSVKEQENHNPLRVLSQDEVVPDGVEIRDAEIVGRYAVQFSWSDGHREGIYSFDYLMQLCQCERCREISSSA